LGTSVSLPLEHDVFDLAKTVATLDRLSRGRLVLGVGTGWNEEELANCRPVPWRERYRALAECVGALRVLWSEDEAQYHGHYFDFDSVWSFPKPTCRPGPPILCGTAGRLGTRHAVEWADGWLPMDVGLGDVAKKLSLVKGAAAAAGRELPVTIVAWGDPTLDTLLQYRDLGVERVVLGAARRGLGDPATTYPFIDRYATMLEELA
jgi:alkanesulfonate monooxygenase SsuD/methylene tetrahydromethanopterin reductase-like flavin-dependent oxidoreductase (luciferase family)